MDLAPSPAAREIIARLEAFMDEHVYPAESVYSEQLEAAGPRSHVLPPVVESLKLEARRQGMWNLFMPALSGLSHLDYAHIAEVTGRSPYIAPEALNCAAPDTGNMEILHLVGTREQKERWLQPLLDGTMRSDPRCEILVVMGKTNAEAEPHKQQSMILVPVATAGVEIVRSLPIFGYHDQHGHCEIRFDNVRVPATNMLASEGDGFAIAQARLGPGRIHHAMRCIGMAERGLDLMVRRAQSRNAFGGPISDQGVVRTWIAESRMEIEQARLLVLKTAWLIDQVGAKGAQIEIAAVKVIGPRVARNVLNRSIQCHGGGGVTDDFPIARMWASARILGIADGPDEVHIRSVARHELRKHR
eukprot:gene23774-28503_t